MEKKVYCLFLGLFLGICAIDVNAQANSIDLIRSKMCEIYLSPYYPDKGIRREIEQIKLTSGSPDTMIRELYDYLYDDEVNEYYKALLPQAYWKDIDYADHSRSGWQPIKHLERLAMMSKAYCSKKSEWYKNDKLKQAIFNALDFWHQGNFQCRNWWYNQIGCPKTAAPIYLLLYDELSKDQLEGAIRFMGQAKIGMTGQNRSWLAANVLVKALLLRDEHLVKTCRDVLLAEISNDKEEGIQKDWSFHQHGPQQQFGNYGLAYFNTMSYWARVFSVTPYPFPQQQIDILYQFFEKGMSQIVWRGYMDIHACGRQLFKSSQRGKALSVGRALLNMAEADTKRKSYYMNFLNNYIIDKKSSKGVKISLYNESDMLTHRNKDLFVSLRMSSKRTIGGETINQENLLGYHLGDGATAIYAQGDEYEGIFPVWDWSKIPGVTAYHSEEILRSRKGAYVSNNHSFAGGINYDGVAVAGMVFEKNELSAHKSYFFGESEMLAMGSAIEGKQNYPVYTTIDQTRSRFKVIRDSSMHYHHFRNGDNTYIFSKDYSYQFSVQEKVGNWNRVAQFYDTTSCKESLFTLSIEHGIMPKEGKYHYWVIGKQKADKNKKKEEEALGIKLTRLDSAMHQAVYKDHIYMGVVFGGGVVKVGDSLELIADGAFIYLYHMEDQCLQMIDPAYTEQGVKIEYTFFKESKAIKHVGSKHLLNGKVSELHFNKIK